MTDRDEGLDKSPNVHDLAHLGNVKDGIGVTTLGIGRHIFLSVRGSL